MKNRTPLFWGCDFDPNPDIDGIRRKLMNFMQNQGQASKRGPYDLYKDNSSLFPRDNQAEFFAGKYPCPSWVSATPDFAREIYPEMYRKFIDKGSCLAYAEQFGAHVVSHTPAGRIPVSLGVDHCITGGIYKALAQQHQNMILIVLDKHLDALSPYVRNQMVGYSLEQSNKNRLQRDNYEYHGDHFYGNYDTGSFLNYLLKKKVIFGRDLMVFGIQDAPDPRLRKIDDKRVNGYLAEYDWLIGSGVYIAPLAALRRKNFRGHYAEIENCLVDKEVYLSVDIDVYNGGLGRSARYFSSDGLDFPDIKRLLEWMGLEKAKLVGMDIMELDVNMLKESKFTEAEVGAAYDKLISLAFGEV
ncbi:arginase family protein [Pelotomaculum propionicicum]|uniref:Agmatinase n=1 Tax=Pelotomaculum propionicicum TaxID=258475 RepID=A0A4Y7RJ76_9FIRM|nr:arginase family protein [Pelotomaculum propionicicum]NLI12189.1 arginase family protein [Peptococcaceae bacterium]TEB09044.1 Agmatinase [Pelotomaculum propionicicum]